MLLPYARFSRSRAPSSVGCPYVDMTTRNSKESANRIYLIGRTDGGRALTVVLAPTYDDGVWRPITGWESTRTERALLDKN